MRKLIVILVCICSFNDPVYAASVNVVTTLSTFADLVSEIGGDHVEVANVAFPKFNPHFIQPRPSHVLKVKRADLFVHAGLDLELWRGPLLDAAGNRDVRPGNRGDLDLSLGVALLEVPDRKQSRAEGDIHLFGNPHYWLDPANAKIMAANIANKLSEIDPAHADDYNNRLSLFHERIDRKMAEWLTRMEPYKGYELLGYHNQWPYVVKFLGLRMEHFLEPKPGVPPGPRQLEFLTEHAKTSNVYGIVQAVYFPDRAVKTLSKRTGLAVVKLSQNVGDTPQVQDYISILEYDVSQLVTLFEGLAAHD
ncbi:MAG: metal ABC transporter substrate-binding protein [Candidatus Hydrogenedentes bacterium]|nr:metal ABC transporter substrate-binding protein [Candidatus Hydrogenedentota bacterium]